MSKLEKLIQELCPDGVQYAPLWTLTAWDKKFKSVEKHKQSKIKKYKYYLANELQQLESEEGTVKILTTNVSDLWANECDVKNDVINAEIVCIPWGGNPIVQYFNGKFITGDNRIATSLDTKVLDNKFLYYLLENNLDIIKSFYRGSGLKHPDMSKVLDMIIPVPPLEVQKEIVRLLDDFTAKTAELQTELNKEYEARKKQYGYYQDLLLARDGKEYSLNEVCQIVDCPHSSPKWKETGIPVIRNYNLVNGTIDTSRLSYVDEQEYLERVKRIIPQENDILFSREAPIGNVGIIPANFKCCQGQRVVLLRPNSQIVTPRFMMYALQSEGVKEQINQVQKIGTTVSNFNISDLKNLKLNIPPIELQDEISNKMEAFSRVYVGIFSELQIEIESRQKQYEFYRNKLLTFKELNESEVN